MPGVGPLGAPVSPVVGPLRRLLRWLKPGSRPVAAVAPAVTTAARTAAVNLAEQLALNEAMAEAGERIMEHGIKDSNFPSAVWAKMEHVHRALDGTKITIHYWLNLVTGETKGFKFK
jgi:hypothetical protein